MTYDIKEFESGFGFLSGNYMKPSMKHNISIQQKLHEIDFDSAKLLEKDFDSPKLLKNILIQNKLIETARTDNRIAV